VEGAQSVKGHGFSRAINLANKKRASAPKDSPSRRTCIRSSCSEGRSSCCGRGTVREGARLQPCHQPRQQKTGFSP